MNRELQAMVGKLRAQAIQARQASNSAAKAVGAEALQYLRINYVPDPMVPMRTPESYVVVVDDQPGPEPTTVYMAYADPIGGLSARDVAGTDTVIVEEAMAIYGPELMRKLREIWK